MKKQLILSFGLLAAFSVSAQVSVVKEVERSLKSKNDYPAKIEELKPTFTNEETAETAYPYFVAGKYGIDFFETKDIENRAGLPVNVQDMGHALIDGYGYLVKALQYDTITDAKGKVKTKYSKDIIKMVGKAYNYFDYAARQMWGVDDFKGAYDCWELIFLAPQDPVLGLNAPKAYPDSELNVISYNQGLAAFNLEDWPAALRSFDRAIDMGCETKNVFDFAMAAANHYPDSVRADLTAKYAEMAYPLYGAEDDIYIGNIINKHLQHGNFVEAEKMLNEYINKDPENAQLYFILGAVYENEEPGSGPSDKAIEQYKKCLTFNPDHIMANFQLAQHLMNKASRLDEAANTEMKTADYNAYFKEVVEPLLHEAIVHFEKAYALDPDKAHSALANLRSIYYYLNDGENLERVDNLMKQ